MAVKGLVDYGFGIWEQIPDMAKAVFYLKGSKAQFEGNRLMLTSKLIEHHFEKGAVFNLPDGRVEIIIEGS